jgi:hypothetical protein
MGSHVLPALKKHPALPGAEVDSLDVSLLAFLCEAVEEIANQHPEQIVPVNEQLRVFRVFALERHHELQYIPPFPDMPDPGKRVNEPRYSLALFFTDVVDDQGIYTQITGSRSIGNNVVPDMQPSAGLDSVLFENDIETGSRRLGTKSVR